MNPFKFIYCLLVGHKWGNTTGHWNMCWRCKHLKRIPPTNHITVSDKGISFTGWRERQ